MTVPRKAGGSMNLRVGKMLVGKLLLIALPLLIAVQRANAMATCESLFGTSGSDVWSRLPDDVRPKMERALIQVFNDSEPLLGSWSLVGLRGLRQMGVENSKLHSLMTSRMDNYLAEIRQIGGLKARPKLESDAHPAKSEFAAFNNLMSSLGVKNRPRLFLEKYHFEGFQGLLDEQRALEEYLEHNIFNPKLSAPQAFDLARELGRVSEADDIFDRVILMRGYDEAIQIADKYQDDAKLVWIAHVALADLFYGSHKSYLAKTAIEALKRVKGTAQQLDAHEMLFGLAGELTSQGFLAEAAKATHQSFETLEEIYDEHALTALRSIGQFEKKMQKDSVEWNFIFRVGDPKVRTEIEKILKRDPRIRGALYARYALGEREKIYHETVQMIAGVQGMDTLEKSQHEIEERLQLLSDLKLNSLYLGKVLWFVNPDDLVFLQMSTLREKLYEQRDAVEVATHFAIQHGSLNDRRIVREGLTGILRSGRFWKKSEETRKFRAFIMAKLKDLRTHDQNPATMDWLDAQEGIVRKALNVAKGFSEAQRAEERELGQKAFRTAYFEQDYITAFEHFGRAGDRENILVVAEALIARGHGLWAIRPLLVAAMMSPSP